MFRTKTNMEMADFWFNRLARKNGMLRKQCNSSRPTNTFRFVVSPSRGPKNTIYLPEEIFNRGKFLFMGKDRRYRVKEIKENNVVMFE